MHGRIDDLSDLLADDPDLAVRRSAYGLRATLLHYTAANGVEIRRQVVPANAANVVAALLAASADRSAKLHAYGGEFDGVQCDLERRAITAPKTPRKQPSRGWGVWT